MSKVYGINLFSYPRTTSTILALNGNNAGAVGYVSGPPSLFNVDSPVIRSLNSFISHAHIGYLIPLQDVSADVVFVIDSTTNMNQTNYGNVISWILSLIDDGRFFIQRDFGTQFAVLSYADGRIGTQVNFTQGGDVEQLRGILSDNSTYPNSFATTWNLAGALTEVQGLLQESAGWRNRSTTIIYLGISATFVTMFLPKFAGLQSPTVLKSLTSADV